jgi:hypothetical protein
MQPFTRHATFVFAILSLVGAKSALAGGPSFHHHDKDASGEDQDHYKDEGEKPARAQVGGTVFRSRALLAKDGVTDLEVTTGSFDTSSTPPGHLSEVHVKAFRLDGKHQFDKEFEHLRSGGGYARFSFPLPAPAKRHGDDDDGDHDHDRGRAKDTRLEHGQLLKLHVEGKGLPSADEGEAEAKMETTVKYRPYLTVTSLHYPASAPVKTAVEVSASVIEAMRDSGAHADCVLSVDGKPVDKVPGMWVDANGAVTCHLVYVFTVSGKHSIGVSMQNIVPGEYDSDGDSLSGSIQIDSPSVMAYYANATDLTNTSQFVRDIFATDTSTVPDQHLLSSASVHTQTRTLTGTIRGAVNLPLKKVSYADQSDGTPLTSLTFADVPADSISAIVGDPTYDSVATILRADGATGAWFTMNRYSNAATGAGVTNVSWKFFGGDITYHSESYCKSVAGIFTCSGGDWTLNPPDQVTPLGGAKVTLGKTYGADAVVDDGTAAYSAHPVMTLVTTQNTTAAPAYCRQVTLGGALVKVCTTQTASTTVVVGSASFTPPL